MHRWVHACVHHSTTRSMQCLHNPPASTYPPCCWSGRRRESHVWGNLPTEMSGQVKEIVCFSLFPLFPHVWHLSCIADKVTCFPNYKELFPFPPNNCSLYNVDSSDPFLRTHSYYFDWKADDLSFNISSNFVSFQFLFCFSHRMSG